MIPIGVVASSIASATIPTAPQSFTATAASSTQINLSWAVPSNNGGAAITSYTLKNGATTIYTGAGTSFSHTGLTAGTAYSYTVLATNSAGNGPTASASATTSAAVPAAPVFSFTDTSTGSYEIYGGSNEPNLTVNYRTFNLAWTTPANNGSAITGYRIQYSNNAGATWSTFNDLNASTNVATASTDQGVTLLRVFAINAIGNGAVSNSLDVSRYDINVPGPAGFVPGAPQPASIYESDYGFLTINFPEPATNGLPIEFYTYEFTYDGSYFYPGGISGRPTIASVSQDATVQVRIAAINAYGRGLYGSLITGYTTSPPPSGGD